MQIGSRRSTTYLDYKTSDRDYFVIDIETPGLDPDRIWVCCWLNIKTGEKGSLTDHDAIRRFFEENREAVFIGHNILKFDAPVLVRLLGVRLSVGNCVDTLVLGTLYSPSLDGGHSLDAWGQRLGFPKGSFSDWSHLTPAMVEYCLQDVAVTARLYVRLVKTLLGINFSEKSCWIQHRFTVLLERQRKNGFYFDGERGLALYGLLRGREADLEEDIRRVFKPERSLVGERQMYRKNGSPTAIYLRDQDRFILEPDDATGRYKAFEDVEFSVGSPAQRTRKLLELGWEPEEFTPVTEKGGGGNPKPFDKGVMAPSLERFLADNPTPEVQMMARWMMFNGRANMVNTWLENWNEDDSCIHGKLFVADTLRLRHQAPNTANIPAVRLAKVDGVESVLLGNAGDYTYEARDLWTARPGRILVGTDASGLELRMLAHYLDRREFTRQVVEGDPHQYNADVVGISRPAAKTLIYATLYGAGGPKIARTLGVSEGEGHRIRRLFLERLGLKSLIEECKKEQKRGRIELIDGSQIVCPSPHAALNYKLQGGGARVMAMSSCIADQEVRRNRWDVLKVGDIHDEDQSDCDPPVADDFGSMRVESIRQAGREFDMRVPLDGAYKKGKTWAETH